MDAASWLIVESLSNWRVDRINGFTHFGIPQRFEKLASGMEAGDRLFTYVSGKSCFADIRKIIRKGVRRLPMGGDYELSLPLCIDTAPDLVLDPDHWVPVRDLKDRLTMTRDHTNWSQVFRVTLRRMHPADAVLIDRELNARAASA